jgi:hypothetical protein
VLATGLIDELPHLEGLRRVWGRDLHICPCFDGHEVRDKRFVVFGVPERLAHLGSWVSMWSPHVTVVTKQSLDPAGADRLGVLGIEVVRDEVRGLIHKDTWASQPKAVSTSSVMRLGSRRVSGPHRGWPRRCAMSMRPASQAQTSTGGRADRACLPSETQRIRSRTSLTQPRPGRTLVRGLRRTSLSCCCRRNARPTPRGFYKRRRPEGPGGSSPGEGGFFECVDE